MLGNKQEDLNRQEASREENKLPAQVTAEEARQLGIGWRSPPPEPDICQFCGNTLHRKGIVFGGSVFLWQPFPERCDCEEAAAYWKKYDEEEKQRKLNEEEAKRRQAMQEKIGRLLGKSGIKKRFQQRTFDRFIADTPGRKKAYDIAKAYADMFQMHKANGDGLYIEGTNGTGKTHLAAAIALKLIYEDNVPVICKTSSDLLMDIKKSFDNSSTISEAQILDIYKKVDLLVIDDLGKEQCSDWSMSVLYSILNDRYEDMKPTIITTNYNSDDLIKALTPKGYDNTKIIAVLSRLRETSRVVTMAWEDYRSK